MLMSRILCLLGLFAEAHSAFYEKYPAYPPYCSIPSEMEKRSIPPLQVSNRIGESRLLHVTAIFRHGARTPFGNTLNCWDGYWENPETGVWNCNLTSHATSRTAVFEKRYNALANAPQLSNSLNGTCQVGQLLLQGYAQEIQNGKFLRDAYLFDQQSFDHDRRMRLLDISKSTPWTKVKLRSDDEARTILSGQLVLDGMLGPETAMYHGSHGTFPSIPLSTADFDRDIVDPNPRVCPKLVEMENEIHRSREFKAMDNSEENGLLRKFQRDVLKVPQPTDMHALDCLMTTLCTDRPLPEAVDDYGRNKTVDPIYGSNLLERLAAMNARQYNYLVKASDAKYSKLAMGPLWHEITSNMYPHVHENGDPTNSIALFSGHDTTIIPLLASLDPNLWNDDDWPPYASMMLIEIHEVNIDRNTDKKIFRSDFAFRLLYNGLVLTSNMKGCPPDLELCDLDVLLHRVEPFAVLDRDCGTKSGMSYISAGESSGMQRYIQSALVFALGMGVGILLVYFHLTRSIPFRSGRRVSTEDGDGLVLTQTNGNRFREYGEAGDSDSLT